MKVHNRRPIVEKISNKDHESDIKHAEQHSRWILTLLGIWPSVISDPTRIERFVSKILLPCPSIMIFTLLIPILCHIIMRDISRDELLAVLGPISYQTTNLLKSCILISRRDTIKLCIQHMETDWRRVENKHDREIMMRNLKVGRSLTIICVLGMYGSALFFNTKPLFSASYVNALNQSVRPLAFPGADIFVDLHYGFNYEIVYISNCICVFFLHVIVTAICNLAAVFVTHACGQMQIVMSRLDSLVDSDQVASDIVTIDERIAFIIRNHVRVLRFASKVDAFLREICLMEVVCSTLMICWVEYWCMMVKRIKDRWTIYEIMVLNSSLSPALTVEWRNSDFLALITCFLLLISFCFNLFIFCHIGELLKEQCQQVGRASYMIDWYKLSGKTGLALVLVITIANYPCKLTAGRMMELSYFSFGSIIRTSFAYLNMLRSMAE